MNAAIDCARQLFKTLSSVNSQKELIMHKLISFAIVSFAVAALTGCGVTPSMSTSKAVPVTAHSFSGVRGKAYGGQQPIASQRIQLYQAGTAGYGSGAKGLVAGTGVLTDSNGNFALTGTYTCDTGSQVYLVGAGGNPGAGTNNAAVLLAGLGPCEGLSSATYINLNEVTTVATVWALQAFITAPTTAAVNETGTVDSAAIDIGAPATNATGLAQAFTDINTLVSIASGTANLSTANVILPSSEINTIANTLAACINSPGPSSNTCTSLLSTTTSNGNVANDAVSAAIGMARAPWNGVTTLVGLAATTPPFVPALGSLSDFTLGVNYTGSGINGPSALAIDASGNVWAANATGNTITEISHAGTVLSGANGFTDGAINAPSSLAIDQSGNVWVANAGTSTLSALTSTGAAVTGSPFSGGGLSSPSSVAIDATGNVWVANASSHVSEFSSTGISVGGNSGFAVSGVSSPTALVIDPY